MKVCQLYLVVGFLIFLSQLLTSYAERYLISSQSDFDRLKTNTFQPKDVILFKKGVRFTGMFSPEGKGISGSPIRIDVYGQGHQPRIDTKGKSWFAFTESFILGSQWTGNHEFQRNR